MRSIIYVFVILSLAGCDIFRADQLQERPNHILIADNLFTNFDGFETGLNGVYNKVRREVQGYNDYPGVIMNTGTDALTVKLNTPVGYWNLLKDWGAVNNPALPYLENTFSWLYEVINETNTIITRAENEDVDWSSDGRNPMENKNLIVAEAKAIRAWAYRHLTYLWGDVPLNLNESKGSTIRTDWERTPVDQVRDQIIADLEFAEQYIPVEPELSGRLTKGAVQTYLAEMNLLIGRPELALDWANKVINTPEYSLITERYGRKADQPGIPYMDMFYDGNENRSEGNTEALWVWQFERNVTGGSGNGRGFVFAGLVRQFTRNGVQIITNTQERGYAYGTGRAALTKWALELFGPEDQRGSDFAIRRYYVLRDAEYNAPYPADKLVLDFEYGDTLWFDDLSEDINPEKPDDRTVLWPWSRKTESGTDPENVFAVAAHNDIIYLRLAETYLLKAEAQIILGDLEGAAETINIIRKRANAREISSGDIDIDFLLDERARELTLEEQRRYHLLRTGKWLERTRAYNNNGGQHITERDALFPIPQPVIDANLTEDMPQNTGY